MAPDRRAVPKGGARRRSRSRKRRTDAGVGPAVSAGASERLAVRPRPAGSEVPGRPHALWHPLPLSELLILAGAIGSVIALGSHPASHAALLGASLLAVALGTLEVTLREHLSGFRSHTLLLALIPPIALHTCVILIAGAFTMVPRWVNFPLLAIDALLFFALFRLLRSRFLDSRRRRVLAGAR